MKNDRITVGELHTALATDPLYSPVGLQTKKCLRDLPLNDWTQRVATLYAHKPAADDAQANLIALWWALELTLYDTGGNRVQGHEAVKKSGPLDCPNLWKLRVSLEDLRDFLVSQECPLPSQLFPDDPLNTQALERAALNNEDFEHFFMEALADELPDLRLRLESWEAMTPQAPDQAEERAQTIKDLQERIAELEPYERISPLAELQLRFQEIEGQEEGDPAKSREQVGALLQGLRRHCPSEEQRDLEGLLPGRWQVLHELGWRVDEESALARTDPTTLEQRFKDRKPDWWRGFRKGENTNKLVALFKEYIERD